MRSNIPTLSWTLILACFIFGQSINKVMSASRKLELVTIRQAVQYVDFISGMSYQQIGEIYGFHWETVRSNIRQVRKFIEPINGKIQDNKLKHGIDLILTTKYKKS